MIQEATGIVLKSTPFSDTSMVTRVFTREFGKISLMAKGVRKSKKGAAGILESMNKINFQVNYNDSKDLQILRDLSLVTALTKIRNDYKRLTAGLAMVDMIDKTMQPKDASTILFRLLNHSLEELNNSKSNVVYLYLFFQFQLAKYSGFNPLPHQCYACRNDLAGCYLDKTSGHQYCKSCINHDSIFLPENCCAFLNQLSQTFISEIQNLMIEEDELEIIREYIHSFLILHLHGVEKAKSVQLVAQSF